MSVAATAARVSWRWARTPPTASAMSMRLLERRAPGARVDEAPVGVVAQRARAADDRQRPNSAAQDVDARVVEHAVVGVVRPARHVGDASPGDDWRAPGARPTRDRCGRSRPSTWPQGGTRRVGCGAARLDDIEPGRVQRAIAGVEALAPGHRSRRATTIGLRGQTGRAAKAPRSDRRAASQCSTQRRLHLARSRRRSNGGGSSPGRQRLVQGACGAGARAGHAGFTAGGGDRLVDRIRIGLDEDVGNRDESDLVDVRERLQPARLARLRNRCRPATTARR